MKRPCLDCGGLFNPPGSRCLPCRRSRDRGREATRPSPADRGYGHEWRKLRDQVIARDGACVRCGTTGTQANPLSVHHVVAKALGGDDDMGNLVTLCKSCHGSVGPQVAGGRGAR